MDQLEKKTALETGKRLREIRNHLGLSRLAFKERFGVSERTLRGWESGEYQLKPRYANLLSNLFSSAGFYITPEILLYGKDETEICPEEETPLHFEEDVQISIEVDFFATNNPNHLLLKLSDEAMSPLFSQDDIVGGVKLPHNENMLQKIIGTFCIIETDEGEKYARKILEIKSQKIFSVGILNYKEKSTPFLQDLKINSFAPITRHWIPNNFIYSK